MFDFVLCIAVATVYGILDVMGYNIRICELL
jgi:hypothetical protein